ncbi:efflux RND transporter permease subunit [Catenovulum sp. SM1970]|uniref:efflux RND transporter permease subunit n=1 Tax=Marinifaba aquimaris TaxID=2741323 RepID=UPI00157171C0|nr:efflux RND transporter permease subunit [Marinifaba aquimaris]NTS75580.1 efflux RND transporter permease subunit [Marinifaba aquimaris]
MIAQYCIKRPVFASVISIIIVLVGLVSMLKMPIDQYPDISPPQVTISGSYSGATAAITAESVSIPLEQKVNGVPNMLYMTSSSNNGGSSKIKITFDVGTNPDFAAIDVQNKVKQAESDLPGDVITDGVTVEKTSTSPLMTIILRSSEARFDDLYLSNFVTLQIQQALKRIPGVAKVRNMGARTYSMRVWLQPDALASYGLTPSDVSDAIKEQNANAAAGSLGSQPSTSDINLSLTINASGKLKDADAFGDIIIHATETGALIRLKDVARIELGASAYKLLSQHNGQSAAIAQLMLLPGANALEVAEQVRQAMQALSTQFPQGIEYQIAYDTSVFIEAAIYEVAKTLIEALVLVGAVVFLFLQNWRTTLIPMLAAPVSIIGTFAFLAAFGFTINTISLLAMVLAIGLVVDDAIVVVENVERIIQEQAVSAAKATSIAMQELTGALIATSLVLAAVFLPVAFLGGISGELYKEFAITLTVAVLISTVVALTLSPALCALLMQKPAKPHAFFTWFNQILDNLTAKYTDAVKKTIKRTARSLVLFSAFVGIGIFIMKQLPIGFMPLEDQGTFYADIQLQPGTAVTRTSQTTFKVEAELKAHPAVEQIITLTGENLSNGSGEENAYFQIVLKPWEQRDDFALVNVMQDVSQILSKYPELTYRVFQPPAIAGMGERSGFSMELQDRSGANSEGLAELARQFILRAQALPEIGSISTTLSGDVPMLKLVVDREMVKTYGVNLNDLNSLLKQLTGSSSASDFNMFGRTYKVKVQAEAEFRRRPEDLARFYIKSSSGAMIPLSMLAKIEYGAGAGSISRHNLFTSASLGGTPAPGYSSGQAMAALEKLANEFLPQGFGYEWTGMSFQEKNASGQAGAAMLLAIIFIYLFLAALYESWLIPIPVLLIVPIALAGAALFVYARGIENNLFFQISAVALVGFSAKNSILIVEFARTLYQEKGFSPVDASIEAAKQRFRPIVMTSVSFILGIMPLVISSGPGAQARQAISTGTLGGMLMATSIGIVLVPLFFVIFIKLAEQLRARFFPVSSKQEQEG